MRRTILCGYKLSISYAGRLCLGASPRSSDYPRTQVQADDSYLILGNSILVSFTDASTHSVYLETRSLCVRIRHWWRGYQLYASVLLGASTTMTTPRVWHSIMHNTRNCLRLEVVLFTTLKTTPVLVKLC